MNRMIFRFGVSILLCLFLSTAVAYLQDPTETPTITPTNPPTPTPVYVTPLPANTQAPTWSHIEGEITFSDINAYDCGPGHDGFDHLYSIVVATPGWLIIEARVKDFGDDSLDLDYGLQISASGTPHETMSDIGCWDYSGKMKPPTVTPTNGGVLPSPTPTPSTTPRSVEDYGKYWSHFRVSVYNMEYTEYFFWIGGHTEEDLGEYQMRVYYQFNPPAAPTSTMTPEPSCTPSCTPTS